MRVLTSLLKIKRPTCLVGSALSVVLKRAEISRVLRRHIKVPTAAFSDQMIRFQIHLAFGTRISFVSEMRVVPCSHAVPLQIENLVNIDLSKIYKRDFFLAKCGGLMKERWSMSDFILPLMFR